MPEVFKGWNRLENGSSVVLGLSFRFLGFDVFQISGHVRLVLLHYCPVSETAAGTLLDTTFFHNPLRRTTKPRTQKLQGEILRSGDR